jgi:F-type H+-transporting ATPase subunit a
VEHPFTWVSIIPGLNRLPTHTATAILVTLLLLVLGFVAYRQLRAAVDIAVPDSTLTVRNTMELFVEGFSDLVVGVIGPEGKKYVPLYGTMFLFIFLSNLTGLIPGFTPPTSNVNTTLALGITSFVMYNVYGFQKHGGSYFKHFLGPLWWLIPLMLPLELVDNLLRPITLNLRLLMNMFADHLVLDIFTDLTHLIIPVAFLMLGAFVSLIQAFVFTLLSLVYVALAVAGHGEHEEHGEHAAAHSH